MSDLCKGDMAVLTKDIGGFFGTSVDAGTVGVIVEEGGWLSLPKVKFDGINEVVEVSDDDLR